MKSLVFGFALVTISQCTPSHLVKKPAHPTPTKADELKHVEFKVIKATFDNKAKKHSFNQDHTTYKLSVPANITLDELKKHITNAYKDHNKNKPGLKRWDELTLYAADEHFSAKNAKDFAGLIKKDELHHVLSEPKLLVIEGGYLVEVFQGNDEHAKGELVKLRLGASGGLKGFMEQLQELFPKYDELTKEDLRTAKKKASFQPAGESDGKGPDYKNYTYEIVNNRIVDPAVRIIKYQAKATEQVAEKVHEAKDAFRKGGLVKKNPKVQHFISANVEEKQVLTTSQEERKQTEIALTRKRLVNPSRLQTGILTGQKDPKASVLRPEYGTTGTKPAPKGDELAVVDEGAEVTGDELSAFDDELSGGNNGEVNLNELDMSKFDELQSNFNNAPIDDFGQSSSHQQLGPIAV